MAWAFPMMSCSYLASTLSMSATGTPTEKVVVDSETVTSLEAAAGGVPVASATTAEVAVEATAPATASITRSLIRNSYVFCDDDELGAVCFDFGSGFAEAPFKELVGG